MAQKKQKYSYNYYLNSKENAKNMVMHICAMAVSMSMHAFKPWTSVEKKS